MRMDSHVAGFARKLLDGTHLEVARWRDREREPSLVAPSDHAAVPAQQLSSVVASGMERLDAKGAALHSQAAVPLLNVTQHPLHVNAVVKRLAVHRP